MIHGVLNIYKEPGYTSHDVVAKLRGIVKQKKIGHTGTLDPAAEGVLPVCLGMGTKLCDLLADHDKTYRAVLLLGKETDTQDTTGRILCERETGRLTPDEVRRAAERFVGEYQQIPPMYSALKVGGKKLYELARAGREIERKPRPVAIYELTVENIDLPRAVLTVRCSKGTYIRTLCHDIGQALGCGGCMEQLIRTRVGRFSAEEALTLSRVQELEEAGRLAEAVISLDGMLDHYPAVVLEDPLLERLARNGNPLPGKETGLLPDKETGLLPDKETGLLPDRETGPLPGAAGQTAKEEAAVSALRAVRIYDSGRRLIGLYEQESKGGRWMPKKMFLGGE